MEEQWQYPLHLNLQLQNLTCFKCMLSLVFRFVFWPLFGFSLLLTLEFIMAYILFQMVNDNNIQLNNHFIIIIIVLKLFQLHCNSSNDGRRSYSQIRKVSSGQVPFETSTTLETHATSELSKIFRKISSKPYPYIIEIPQIFSKPNRNANRG